MTNPMEALKRLRARLAGEMHPIGLEVVGFNVPVKDDDSSAPDMLQVVFGIKPDVFMTPEEQQAAKDADVLKEMEANMAHDNLLDRTDEAATDIQEWLDNNE